MTRFKLSQKKVGKLLTTFHITDEAGNTVGSVNVPNALAGDLAKHWAGSIDRGEQQSKLKIPPLMGRMPRAMVLRGC